MSFFDLFKRNPRKLLFWRQINHFILLGKTNELYLKIKILHTKRQDFLCAEYIIFSQARYIIIDVSLCQQRGHWVYIGYNIVCKTFKKNEYSCCADKFLPKNWLRYCVAQKCFMFYINNPDTAKWSSKEESTNRPQTHKSPFWTVRKFIFWYIANFELIGQLPKRNKWSVEKSFPKFVRNGCIMKNIFATNYCPSSYTVSLNAYLC